MSNPSNASRRTTRIGAMSWTGSRCRVRSRQQTAAVPSRACHGQRRPRSGRRRPVTMSAPRSNSATIAGSSAGSSEPSASRTATISVVAATTPACTAEPYPGCASVTTCAPWLRATLAVPSVLSLSTTSTRYPRGMLASTPGRDSASLRQGSTTVTEPSDMRAEASHDLYLSDHSSIFVSLNGERAAAAMAKSALRKFKFERRVGRVVNPLVAALDRRGIRSKLVVELETTGRKTGEPRRVPLTGTADADGVWVISQHGRRAGWAHNIEADPRVRVRVDGRWRDGTAVLLPDDDVRARARSFAGGKVSAAATALAMRAMESDPISVRITFSD